MGTEGIPAARHAHGLRTLGLRVSPAAPEPRHPPRNSGSVRGDLRSGARRGRPVCATSLVVAPRSKIKTFQRKSTRMADYLGPTFVHTSYPNVCQQLRLIGNKP